MVNKQQQQQQQQKSPRPPRKSACLQTPVCEEGKESTTTNNNKNKRTKTLTAVFHSISGLLFLFFFFFFFSSFKSTFEGPGNTAFSSVFLCLAICVRNAMRGNSVDYVMSQPFPSALHWQRARADIWLRPDQLKFAMKTAVLLRNTYEQNYHPKSANGHACTFSTFFEQLASLLGVPFNFHNTSRFV